MPTKTVGSKVRVNAFEDINLLAGIEGKSVSKLIKDSLGEYATRRAEIMVECVDNGSMTPAAIQRARVYRDLANEFKK